MASLLLKLATISILSLSACLVQAQKVDSGINLVTAENTLDWKSAESLYGGNFGEADTDEDDIEGSIGRRSLFWKAMQFYISYGALAANRIPCPPRSGRSYYTHNCYRARGPVHPYTRGCSAITRCRRTAMEVLFKVFLYFLLPLILLRFLVQLRRSQRLPPGPLSLPIIGNLLKLGDKPHLSLTQLAQTYGPIMSLKLGQITTIVISSPLAAQEVLQKQDISFSNRFIPDAVRACDEHKLSVVWLPINERWRSLRKLAHTHVFSGRVLDSNEHIRRRKVEELIAYVRRCFHENVAVDVGRAAFQTSLNVISNTLFSVDLSDWGSENTEDFKDLVWNIMVEAGKPNLVDYFPALRPIDPQRIRGRMSLYFSKLLGLFGEMIDRKMMMKTFSKDMSERDVIDSLLKMLQDNEDDIDREHVEHMCLDFFAAGTDTTSSTLEWAMTELLRQPTSMKNAKNELKRVVGVDKQVLDSDISHLPYLQAVIKETLRIHPPVPFLVPRQVYAEIDLCGYTIPKGAQVLVNVWAIGRDPDYWQNPSEFKPERFLDSKIDVRGQDFELLPFGGGRRICVGISLAMRILSTMLGSLINSFDWKVEGDLKPEDLDMEDKFGITLQRANPLRAVPVPILL